MATFLSNPALLALASLMLTAGVAFVLLVCVVAIALRNGTQNGNTYVPKCGPIKPLPTGPLKYAPMPPPQKRQKTKAKAIIRPMRFDGPQMQNFHFK